MSSKFDARLAKLEAIADTADESRHWAAVRALQPALTEMYWRSRREHWPVAKYFDHWRDMHRDLPPFPKKKHSDPSARQRLIDEVLEKLRGTAERLDAAGELLGISDDFREQIRQQEADYLASEEHQYFLARLQIKE